MTNSQTTHKFSFPSGSRELLACTRSRTLRVSAAACSNSARACVARPEACSIVSSSSHEMTPLPGYRFVVTRWRSEVSL